MAELEKLGFYLAGYGCTTCIGNSGPVDDAIAAAVKDGNLVVASVLSGNRNFEGRVNPVVRANYLASPPLVVAYALAGTMNIDLETEPLGTGSDGKPVFLQRPLAVARRGRRSDAHGDQARAVSSTRYAHVLDGDAEWQALAGPGRRHVRVGRRVDVHPQADASSTTSARRRSRSPTSRARACSRCSATRSRPITSRRPATSRRARPAAKYLDAHGVKPADYNQYGARRGNHEVMVRGTFANIRLKNLMLGGVEGGFTKHLPDGAQMPIYDAAMKYAERGRAADRDRRRAVRHRQLARLGGEGHAAARRARRDREELRAHPSLEPDRHGRPAAAVRARRGRRSRSASPATR